MSPRTNKKPQHLDSNSSDYLYYQISKLLRADIETGKYPVGSRLPSLDKLSAYYRVNRLTVLRAENRLRELGLIYSLPAQGTYVARRLAESTEEAIGRTRRSICVIGLISRVLVPSKYGLYHRELIAGVHEELEQTGASLLTFAMGETQENELPGIVAEAPVNAMIYMGPFNRAILMQLINNGVPSISVDFGEHINSCDSILVDNVRVGELAAEQMLARGYRDGIALITGPSDAAASIDRYAGFVGKMAEAGIPQGKIGVECGNFNRYDGADAMMRLVSRRDRPRVVFCFNDEMAIGSYDALWSAGFSIPDDIAILSCDDTSLAPTLAPPLSSIRVDSRQMGRMAVRQLMQRMSMPDSAMSEIVLQPTVSMRDSLPSLGKKTERVAP